MDRPLSKLMPMYVLLRYELPLESKNLQNSVSVLKVFASREDADAEALRLGLLNDRSKCIYQVQPTHFVDRKRE
jgi:hypothetical protein